MKNNKKKDCYSELKCYKNNIFIAKTFMQMQRLKRKFKKLENQFNNKFIIYKITKKIARIPYKKKI